MSGIGNRFIEAGYPDPKPLIKIDGKTIIEHVVNLFPSETNISFICNAKHLAETQMRSILKDICPSSHIYEIPNHKKGPVFAVAQIFDQINDDEEVIVNYCDFSKYWDYTDFLAHTRARNADGAIPSYKNFHPHMLGTTNYAFIRDTNQWMSEIREKQPFTDNRMEEYASDGTYYFKSGAIMKKYFQLLMDSNIDLNGEFYVSMVYNLLVKDGLKVSVYDVQHMLQWGTPQDVEEYNKWSDYFRNIIKPQPKINNIAGAINLIPLAGAGSRFAKEGYQDPKPLIPVSGKPMIVQAANYLPTADQNIFVCLAEHLDAYPLEKSIKNAYANAKVVSLNHITEGQACTCDIGLESEDLEKPLLIAACDNGMIWDAIKYQSLLNDPKVDAIYWSFKNHPSSTRNPQMYGWIKTDENDFVKGVSVKVPISDQPKNDHAVVGTFYFKKAAYFKEALSLMYQKNIRVNNEFYVDSIANELIELNLNVKVFEVTDYICWGTPNDYRTFEYWQSFFHKCDWHPYTLDQDTTMDQTKIAFYSSKYSYPFQPNV